MEVIIGMALMLIVFVGIFGIIQLSFKMVGQSKARITATSLGNEKMETVRNMPYDQIGTLGGIPPGSIIETETTIRNGITYTIKTSVIYIDDPFDDVFPADSVPTDYKHVRVKITWTGFLGGEVALQTDVAPKGVETTVGGGILSVLVFDASGQPISQADVHIENSTSSPPIDQHYQTDSTGHIFLPGAPACADCYKITATKANFSTDRTYLKGELVRGVAVDKPLIPYVSVIENKLSEVSFSIDRLATKTVQTVRYVEEKNWSDSFDDETKISEKNQVSASSTLSALLLDEQIGQYFPSGWAVSVANTPVSLAEWSRLTFNADAPPGTDLKIQLLYSTSSTWELIPDSDLTISGVKNSDGFPFSPIDLTGLNPVKYHSLKIKANFSTSDLAQTPKLYDWEIAWFTSDTGTPVPNLAFLMQGSKTIGSDALGNPIYKYEQNLNTDASGQIVISNLEWDTYKISVSASSGYDIANSEPPQPVAVNPGAIQTTILKLAAHFSDTFLVTVQNSAGQPLAGASVRLYKSGYDKTKLSSASGQAFFSPLSAAVHNLEIQMSGYQDWTGTVDIAGQTELVVVMTPP